ncbi:hypothetical protein ES705_08895 [subsurface metagenome]|nr:hypothetical protein [Methanosarcinales archaeon]
MRAYKNSETRLAEAKAMTELGKPEWAGGLMEDYMEELNESFMCMQRQREGHIMDLAEHVCNATDKHAVILSYLVDEVPEQERPHIKRAINMTYKHVEVLEALLELDKVPEQAKPHIEHAINVSIHGHETSVNRTQKGLQEMAEKI